MSVNTQMKDFISAIAHTTANRLRSPILGSFILCWLIINHNELLYFFYSNSDDKLSMLSIDMNSTFWTTEPSFLFCPLMMKFIYPALLALAYIFGLPFIQNLIDQKKFKHVEKKLLTEKHQVEVEKYAMQAEVSSARAKISPDYQQKILDRHLDDWTNQKEQLTTQITRLQESYEIENKQKNELNDSYNKLKSEFSSLEEENKELKLSCSEKDEKANKLTIELENHQEQMDYLVDTSSSYELQLENLDRLVNFSYDLLENKKYIEELSTKTRIEELGIKEEIVDVLQCTVINPLLRLLSGENKIIRHAEQRMMIEDMKRPSYDNDGHITSPYTINEQKAMETIRSSKNKKAEIRKNQQAERFAHGLKAKEEQEKKNNSREAK